MLRTNSSRVGVQKESFVGSGLFFFFFGRGLRTVVLYVH